MRSTLLFLLLLGGAAAMPACSYDNAEDLAGQPPPAPACDSTAATYALTVAPLLQQRCTGCHNTAAPAGNISLQTHAQVQAAARSGRLVGAISQAPGFRAMPPNGSKLADCDIASIRQWVRAGALNN